MAQPFNSIQDLLDAGYTEAQIIAAVKENARYLRVLRENQELSRIAREEGMTLADIRARILAYDPMYMHKVARGK